MTVMSVDLDPVLQQRFDALARANAVRSFKAQRKVKLAFSAQAFVMAAAMLRDPADDPENGIYEGAFTVYELVLCLPGIGKTKAKTLIKQVDVSAQRRLREITPRQREELALMLEARAGRRAA